MVIEIASQYIFQALIFSLFKLVIDVHATLHYVRVEKFMFDEYIKWRTPNNVVRVLDRRRDSRSLFDKNKIA